MVKITDEKAERRFTDVQIDQANSINIIEYARNKGYPVKQVSTNSFKIPGYGGLYIHTGGLKWNRFSADIGGGTIQFVMHMENKSWVEAVKELLSIQTSNYYSPSAVPEIKKDKESERKSFRLPQKNNTYKHMFAYLIGERKLDKQIVYDLVKHKKVYESRDFKACVFVGYSTSGNAKYATIRGASSYTKYRKDVAGSDKSYPFAVDVKDGEVQSGRKIENENLYVFESPIDLMSYLSLLKLYGVRNTDAHFISLGGVCDLALERFLEEHSEIKEIILCLDNDNAGHLACENIHQKYSDKYVIRRHVPERKDFNDDLVFLVSQSLNRHEVETNEQEAGI